MPLETSAKKDGYGFLPKAIGYLYFTRLIVVLLRESFGHFFNDFLANRYVRKNNGLSKPEAWLISAYVLSHP